MSKKDFALSLDGFANLSEKRLVTVAKKVFIGLSTDIIMNTARDTSRLASNWQMEINGYENSTTNSLEPASATINKIKAGTQLFTIKDRFLSLSNNLPYAQVVEFGLYPKNSQGVKTTTDGYSTQSDGGMVRPAMLRAKKWVKKATKDSQSIKK